MVKSKEVIPLKEKISIIVPVYNAEEYVENTVQSIINQTYKNIQIILVDDGSIDQSLKIIQQLAKKEKRIKVIHQENKGVSAARNTGILSSQLSLLVVVLACQLDQSH